MPNADRRGGGKALSVRWFAWQCVTVGVLAIVYSLFARIMQADMLSAFLSFLLGGSISILAGSYFAWKLFSHTAAPARRLMPQRIVANLYIAEALKLLISAAGLAVVFAWLPVDPVAVLIGFIITYLTSLIIVAVLSCR